MSLMECLAVLVMLQIMCSILIMFAIIQLKRSIEHKLQKLEERLKAIHCNSKSYE